MQELVLGTAQFGAGYGITNARGRLTDVDVQAIMRISLTYGIRRVDTALGYGDAQTRLRPFASELAITTKVPGAAAADIADLVRDCLDELGTTSVDSVLLHDWHAISSDERPKAATSLEQCRSNGMVRAVGISAYDAADLESAHGAFSRIDVVQVPANALDRRLDDAPVIERLRAEGVRVQVRSAFLQGLLAGRSTSALSAHPAVVSFHAAAEASGRSPLVAALSHVRALPWADEVLVGVTSEAELAEIWTAWQEPGTLADPSLATDDLTLIDPRRW